jgi:hypothetical protein
MPAFKSRTADDLAAAELSKLFVDTGIDLSTLPAIMTAEDLAPVLGVTVGSLANERYRRVGIPHIKHGKRVRYLRADVARYLIANRKTYASA